MGKENVKYLGQAQSVTSLISAPLTAVSKANMSMLSGQTRFILNNCFQKDDQGVYHPVMVDMSISRQNIRTGESATLTFQVPLLSLLPLNSLAVEKAKLDFSLDVTSSVSYTSDTDATDLVPRKSVLLGRLVREKKGSNNQSAHLKVNVKAGTVALPDGLKTLLDLYAKAILPTGGNENE